MIRRITFLIFTVLILAIPGIVRSSTPLTTADINKIMSEILSEHVEEKTLSPAKMRNAIQLYIDHFDPDRLYLTAAEVAPYQNLSDNAIQQLLTAVSQGNYAFFEKMDQLFKQGIWRARALRHFSGNDRAMLFQEAAQAGKVPTTIDNEKEDLALPKFESSVQGLKHRWQGQMREIIRLQMEQDDVARIQNNPQEVMERIEGDLRKTESSYLGVNSQGAALTTQEQQHIFSLHVLKALASSLDPHTAFFDDQEASAMKQNLDKSYEGIGIVFARNSDGFIINDLIPNSPASKSNLVKAQDLILAINGTKLQGKTLDEVSAMMHGQRDEDVSLLLKRKGPTASQPIDQMIEVRLKNETITLNSDRVDSGYVPYKDGILGWVTLHSFYEGENGVTSAEDVTKAVSEMRNHGDLRGLILDLRNNGGGYLTQAVKVAGLFISDGVIVISKYNDGTERFYRDIHPESIFNGPLIVLTSRLTASAAEIVAQALQDYGVALIVGDDRTYGKGTIQAQTVTEGNASSYFKVTVGKYYTVSGRTAQISGVLSDIPVPGRYSQMQVGEMYLKDALPKDSIAPAFVDPLLDVDPLVKDWYLRYYLPSLQKPVLKWREQIPRLRELSEQRLKDNPAYRAYLRVHETPKLNATDDQQIAEGIKILEDMNQSE